MAPFLFKPGTKDRHLPDKLRQEWPGILRWMIDGCLDWQKNGLIRPNVVVDATAEYFEAQDLLAQWLAERCEKKAISEALPRPCIRSWSTWTKARGRGAWHQQVVFRSPRTTLREEEDLDWGYVPGPTPVAQPYGGVVTLCQRQNDGL